ncbi:MAG: molybdenum cofactor guanylyltransferase MobA [Acidisphaera sp.]|nr:molybdenum cofactor guanylyltransferase MobA [Acidisphaera sp.]
MRADPLPLGVLLAGGLARRMGGGDKPLRSLAGRPLLDHVIDRMRPQLAGLVINANGDPARFAAWGLPVIPDTMADNPGPLAGVLAGMLWARAHAAACPDIVSLPTDTPFLPEDLVGRLQAARRNARADLACVASGGRSHPVIGLWPVHLADDLAGALAEGVRKIEDFTARHRIAIADYDAADLDPFTNVNRPEELAAVERRLRETPD